LKGNLLNIGETMHGHSNPAYVYWNFPFLCD